MLHTLLKRFWPFLLVAGLSPFFKELDLYCSGLFYENGRFVENFPLKLIYHLGPIPSLVACAVSFCLVPFYRSRLQISLLLTMGIGSGLIINTGLKEYWQRPRPKQILNFGGRYEYRAYYSPDLSKPRKPLKSFPSGHASTGFFFLASTPFFRREKLSMRPFFLIGIILSPALCLTRIMQGGHFLSDVALSGIIMYATAKIIERAIYGRKSN